MNTEAKEATLARPSQVVGNAQVLEVNSDWKDGGVAVGLVRSEGWLVSCCEGLVER